MKVSYRTTMSTQKSVWHSYHMEGSTYRTLGTLSEKGILLNNLLQEEKHIIK